MTVAQMPVAQTRVQGYFMIGRTSCQRNTILAGMIAVALASCPVLAAAGSESPPASPGQPSRTCANSTDAIKQLAVLTKAGNGDFQCLGVVLDGNAVKEIRVETHSFASPGQPPGQEQIKVDEYPQTMIEGDHGAVLDGVPGHDAIILRGHFPPPLGKAKLVFSYLYNGFTSDYHSCEITLGQAADSSWHLANQLDQTITHIIVRTRRLPLIGDYGIANLEGACS
jgi:hypothetical protein